MIVSVQPDLPSLSRRLTDLTGTTIDVLHCVQASTGHANATWLLEAHPMPLALKVQTSPPVVYQRDPAFEPSWLQALGDTRFPAAELVATDPEGHVFDAPWFAMKRITGASLPDDPTTGYMGAGWFAQASLERRACIWNGFIDRLCQLHELSPRLFGPAARGGCHSRMLDYWEASLLDAVERRDAAIQVRAIDWLRAKMPAGADDDPRPCMGDARMANLIEREGEVVALIDWELAYIGNPQGDVGYHLYLDSRYGTLAGGRLDGLPSPDETWRRWEQRSGIAVADPRYWTAYGALVIAITATRALRLVHNLAAADVERRNPFVADLHRLIAVSARHAQPNAGARSKNGSNA